MASSNTTTQQGKNSSTYEAINRIGRGAYGTVYKARDKQTGLEVALKKVCIPMTEDGIPMNTLREIALLQQLNHHDHPNVVKLLDICHGQQMGRDLMMFLVFEHVEQDLAMYMSKNPKGFSVSHIRDLSREIVNGVDFLHSNRIVHRDLKPQNLLVTKDGHIKLADFGLAKTYDYEMKLTSVVVTLWYRAPEVLFGLPYSSAVDIWSIGCIIVELYTRSPLFCGKSENEQLTEILRVLGKPPKNEWPEEHAPIKWNAFNVVDKVDIKSLAPNMCESALSLIMKMLTFDPNKRITALEALGEDFFLEEPLNT
ncbi:cyclin-dependent kinase 4-like [Anthonomus grandis grandis]|uniref:cyclin-dependent kinase 4-like n=1 Tax=Anthonomus grandis grandis TaxID=2921223 RepID=UPI002166043D|nr:cyclin-dependent kinase 4-like [Anthonomus grandis grandis]